MKSYHAAKPFAIAKHFLDNFEALKKVVAFKKKREQKRLNPLIVCCARVQVLTYIYRRMYLQLAQTGT